MSDLDTNSVHHCRAFHSVGVPRYALQKTPRICILRERESNIQLPATTPLDGGKLVDVAYITHSATVHGRALEIDDADGPVRRTQEVSPVRHAQGIRPLVQLPVVHAGFV